MVLLWGCRCRHDTWPPALQGTSYGSDGKMGCPGLQPLAGFLASARGAFFPRTSMLPGPLSPPSISSRPAHHSCQGAMAQGEGRQPPTPGLEPLGFSSMTHQWGCRVTSPEGRTGGDGDIFSGGCPSPSSRSLQEGKASANHGYPGDLADHSHHVPQQQDQPVCGNGLAVTLCLSPATATAPC